MPKLYTFPTLYDDTLKIHLSRLKKLGLLNPNQINWGSIKWSRKENPTGSISIFVNTFGKKPFIELGYTYKEEQKKYTVYLTSKPSNLKRGEIWYFICPVTEKLCRKLYFNDGYFLHRDAFKGCFYEKQTQSKKYRKLDKTLGAYLKREQLYSELDRKYFKKFYSGKPTKKYLRIMKKIQEAENISYKEIMRAILN